MTKPRKAIEPSHPEVARGKEALLKERADAATQAAANYEVDQDVLRAKTACLRPLQLARKIAGWPEKKSK
jgi:hypothetical protein